LRVRSGGEEKENSDALHPEPVILHGRLNVEPALSRFAPAGEPALRRASQLEAAIYTVG